ncbi:transporter substrate-binding domain-containing protein [Alteromonas sp. ASW11-19]|uniref:Transporter substrate-binding domain-containing protein n=1 Tax=Alteromonas salexigens TaxID=2982530 RepID=A0ABT2VPR6_9ALTE|nr:transporter substrate-binding domain-containing protein [Alteromonas salexigens]MCU7555303.1 transporter substrate-binding domain-containing protein [Alteromonas salexigens]
MNKCLLCSVLLGCWLISLTVSASAERVYRVGVEDVDYYPVLDFVHSPPRGVVKNVLDSFAEQTGVKFEYIPLPIQRFNSWYDTGRIDFRVPDNPRWSLTSQPSLIYSVPFLNLCEVLVVKAENRKMSPDNVTRIGTLMGFTPSTYWNQKMESGAVRLVPDRSLKVLTRMLLNDMVSGLDLDLASIHYQLKTLSLPPDLVAPLETVENPTISYRMSTLNHPEIIRQFNQFMARNKDKLTAQTYAEYPHIGAPCY